MCRAEAPHLTTLQTKYGSRGFEVIAVNADNDTQERIQAFARKQQLRHRILLHGSGVATDTFHAGRYPTKYWIDRSGRIVARHYGGERPGEIEQKLKQLLKSSG